MGYVLSRIPVLSLNDVSDKNHIDFMEIVDVLRESNQLIQRTRLSIVVFNLIDCNAIDHDGLVWAVQLKLFQLSFRLRPVIVVIERDSLRIYPPLPHRQMDTIHLPIP